MKEMVCTRFVWFKMRSSSGSIKGTEFLNYFGDSWLLNEKSAPLAMQDVCDPVVLHASMLGHFTTQMCMILDCTELVIPKFEMGG